MKTLILGLGNPLLGDDGVGWRVVDQVRTQITDSPIEVDYHAGGGLALMERLVGYDYAIIVDAIDTGNTPQGTVSCFPLENLPNNAASHLASAHETNLQTALQVGHQMGAVLPSQVLIVSVESTQVFDFSEELSLAVAHAVPRAVHLIVSKLQEITPQEEK